MKGSEIRALLERLCDMIADAVTVRVERSKVGGGGVQDVVLDLGVRGLGQVSLWKPEEAVKVDSSYVM